MMKLNLRIIGAAVTIGMVIAIALALSTSSAIQPMKEIQPAKGVAPESGAGLSPVYDLNSAGRDVSLSEVMTSIELSQPTYLPSGTSQPQAKMNNDGSLAALIYTNPNLPRINFYKQNVQIVVIAERDGTTFEGAKIASEKYPKTGFYPITITMTDKDGREYTKNATEYVIVHNHSIISVAGNPGFGFEPTDTPVQESGRVQWWSKEGIRYEIIANLPVQELLKIAESIQQA